MHITLRDYQSQSVYLLDRALSSKQNPLCVLPTGSGKSIVIAALLTNLDARALVLSHNAELLVQNSKVLERYAPQIPQSFFAAKLKRKNAGGQVVFGSVQSIVRSLHRFVRPRSLLLIDEAHLCPRDADAMYARVFEHFSNARRVGFTATAARLDSGSLIEGTDSWFDCIAHEVGLAELIEKGYLLPLSGIISELQAKLDDVAVSAKGEFIESESQKAVMETLALPAVVKQATELAARRKSWLVFAAGIEHAKQVVQEFRRQGVDTEMVVSTTGHEERNEAVERFRDRKLKCLVNVGVLTTGFDSPFLDCIIMMRPTQSPILWQQILGRGMRLAEGKKDCLLLDFVGNLERLGGANAVLEISDRRFPSDLLERRPPTAKKAPARKQPEFYNASGRDPMQSGELFDASVIRSTFFIIPSRKQPGKNIVVVSYTCEDEFGRAFSASSFLCVEYVGGARYLASKWFERRGVIASEVPYDARTALALAKVLPEPAEVQVRRDARMRSYLVEHERFAL